MKKQIPCYDRNLEGLGGGMALVGQDGLTALMKVGADFRLCLLHMFSGQQLLTQVRAGSDAVLPPGPLEHGWVMV